MYHIIRVLDHCSLIVFSVLGLSELICGRELFLDAFWFLFSFVLKTIIVQILLLDAGAHSCFAV